MLRATRKRMSSKMAARMRMIFRKSGVRIPSWAYPGKKGIGPQSLKNARNISQPYDPTTCEDRISHKSDFADWVGIV